MTEITSAIQSPASRTAGISEFIPARERVFPEKLTPLIYDRFVSQRRQIGRTLDG